MSHEGGGLYGVVRCLLLAACTMLRCVPCLTPGITAARGVPSAFPLAPAAGLNPLFDTFDCQEHFFASPEPNKVFAKINWRIPMSDALTGDQDFIERSVMQKFVQVQARSTVCCLACLLACGCLRLGGERCLLLHGVVVTGQSGSRRGR